MPSKGSGRSAGKGRGRGSGYVNSGPDSVFTDDVASCIFLEEIKYFFMDVFRCSMQDEIRYMLALAGVAMKTQQDPTSASTFEVTEGVIASVQEEIRMQKGTSGRCSATAAITCHPSMKLRLIVVKDLQAEVKRALCSLQFLRGGTIEIFDLPMKSGSALCKQDHRTIMQLYAAHVRARDGMLWDLPLRHRGESLTLFARCVVVCPIYYDRMKEQLFIMAVWGEKHESWNHAGGDVIRSIDNNLNDTGRREFDEELEPFGIRMSDISLRPLEEILMLPVDLDLQEVAKYDVTPHMFFEVQQAFFEDTFDNATPSTCTKVVDPEAMTGFVTTKSPPSEVRKFHLDDRLKYLEHIEWGWVSCDIRCDSQYSTADPSSCTPGPLKFVDKTNRNSRKMSPRNERLLTNMKMYTPNEWIAFARRFLN